MKKTPWTNCFQSVQGENYASAGSVGGGALCKEKCYEKKQGEDLDTSRFSLLLFYINMQSGVYFQLLLILFSGELTDN